MTESFADKQSDLCKSYDFWNPSYLWIYL